MFLSTTVNYSLLSEIGFSNAWLNIIHEITLPYLTMIKNHLTPTRILSTSSPPWDHQVIYAEKYFEIFRYVLCLVKRKWLGSMRFPRVLWITRCDWLSGKMWNSKYFCHVNEHWSQSAKKVGFVTGIIRLTFLSLLKEDGRRRGCAQEKGREESNEWISSVMRC